MCFSDVNTIDMNEEDIKTKISSSKGKFSKRPPQTITDLSDPIDVFFQTFKNVFFYYSLEKTCMLDWLMLKN